MEKIVMLADRYIRIQDCDEGFDYNIYDLVFHGLDGGVMEEECSLDEALEMLVQELRANEGYAKCVYGRVAPVSKVKELSVDGLELVLDAELMFQNFSTYSVFAKADGTAFPNSSHDVDGTTIRDFSCDLEDMILVGAGLVDSFVTPGVVVKENNIRNQVLVLQLKEDVRAYYVDEDGVYVEDSTLLSDSFKNEVVEKGGDMYIYSPFTGNVPVSVAMEVKNRKLSISLLEEEDGVKLPYADLTVDIDGMGANETCAYVDVNNLPEAQDFIEKYGLGEYAGIQMWRGCCVFPLYRFNMDVLNQYV